MITKQTDILLLMSNNKNDVIKPNGPRAWSNIKLRKKPVSAKPVELTLKRKIALEARQNIYRFIQKKSARSSIPTSKSQTKPLTHPGFQSKTSPATKPTKQGVLKSRLKKSKGLIFVITIAIIVSVWQVPSFDKKDSQPIKINHTSVETIKKEDPGFQTILPTGKTATDLGGWTRVSPPSSEPAYAYTDKIDGNSIIVSQQQLPEDFKSDTAEQVRELAEGFNAKEKININDNTIYIGTASNGVQSVIFTKNNLLILIKSYNNISENSWIKYIESMQ